MNPSAELDANLPDGVVAEKVFVEQFESDAQHSQEVLDEDDAFLGSAAAGVWEYEVVDARAQEFEVAIANSDLVLEYDVVDSTITEAEDAPGGVLGEDSVYPRDGAAGEESGAGEVTAGGSGVRAGDDGPAGMPTGDASAGGLGRGPAMAPASDFEGNGTGGSGIDDLNVVKASDQRLGLTNRGSKPPEDWAANTGPTRNPEWQGAADGESQPEEATVTAADGKKKRRTSSVQTKRQRG